MPEPLDFDTIKWKTADSMSPEEVDVIVENKDKLNDEEKAAFADLLAQAEPLSDNPLDDQIGKAGDGEEEKKIEAESAKTPEPEIPAAPQLPDNVVTQDKLDSYIIEKRKEWEAEGKSKTEQKEEEEKIKTFFDQGYAPKDWNDYTNAMLDKVAPIIEKRILDRLDNQNKQFQEEQLKLQKSREEVFQRFDAEFQTLAKNKLIPDPKENPDEYKKVHDAIIKIGDENGKSNITDAYKLWSIIPVSHGGGLQTAGQEEVEKAKIEAQKEAAGKIGSGRGAPAKGKAGPPSWASIHSTHMDDLIEQRLRQS